MAQAAALGGRKRLEQQTEQEQAGACIVSLVTSSHGRSVAASVFGDQTMKKRTDTWVPSLKQLRYVCFKYLDIEHLLFCTS